MSVVHLTILTLPKFLRKNSVVLVVHSTILWCHLQKNNAHISFLWQTLRTAVDFAFLMVYLILIHSSTLILTCVWFLWSPF